MNNDAIPEFDMRAAVDRIWKADIPIRSSTHHPNCAECCAVGRCHWCLAAPEQGTLTSKGSDGCSYSACRAHLRYFAEAQRQANPHAGVDLMDGLRDLHITAPTPMLR